jgi:tripartite ATP-independent transporter DctM subunit
MGAACTLIIALLQRRMTWKRLRDALDETLSVTGRIMIIVIAVYLLGFFFASTRLPNELAEFAVSMDTNRWVVFAMIVVFYIIMGCLMNIIPVMLLTLPAIYPTVLELGFDPIWFGVVTVVLMEMGQITPPVGVNVFAISTLAKDVPMERIFRHVLPMFLAMLVCIVILCFFPQIALWLPNLLMN